MTSYDARKDPVGGQDRITGPADAGAIAVERLNAALYGLRVGGKWEAVLLDGVLSIAASLWRLSVSPRAGASSSATDDTVTRHVAALAASVAHVQDDVTANDAHVTALAEAVDRLVTRVDVLEDRP